MSLDLDHLREETASAFAARAQPQSSLADQAGELARAALAMARCFADGGRLLAVGVGAASTDAHHVAVEFVHPVIVGKRAVPAIAIEPDLGTDEDPFSAAIAVMGRRGDVVIGVSGDGHGLGDVLRTARDRGLVTVALVGGGGAPDVPADHVVAVASADTQVVKEVHVCAYHVLWELVHVFLAHPGLSGDDRGPGPTVGSVEALYPSLYGGAASLDELVAHCEASARDKIVDSQRLRAIVAEQAGPLAAAAQAMAARFRAGAKLLTCGNGGSSTDAHEVAQDHLGRGQRRVPAICLTDEAGLVTALSNDVDFEVVFARQVRALADADDVLLGLSTSGSSANLLAGFDEAARMGVLTVGLAGGDGGAMAAADLDHLIVVPSSSVHRTQEVQTTCYHVLRSLVDLAVVGAEQGA